MNQLKRRAPRQDWRDEPGELTEAGNWKAFNSPAHDFRDFYNNEEAIIQAGEAH